MALVVLAASRAIDELDARQAAQADEAAAATTCAAEVVVPVPDSNPGLVQDCETLLALRDALAGGAELDWSSDRSIAEWTGVVLGGSPLRVHGLRLVWLAGRLEGPIPSAISGLPELRVLDLYGNRLTGRIPVELGGLRHLEVLDLGSNWLTGPIPPELGNLANLTSLALGRNLLTGPIPPEIGRLTNLRHLRLHDNRLVGALPPELDGLENLEELFVWRNQLEECLSTALAIRARSRPGLPDWPACEPEVYDFQIYANAPVGRTVGRIRTEGARPAGDPVGERRRAIQHQPRQWTNHGRAVLEWRRRQSLRVKGGGRRQIRSALCRDRHHLGLAAHAVP